jgi:small-conductance mechanosensitive channel
MNNEIRQVWLEILQDFGSQHIFWQVVVLLAAFGVAWLINDVLRAYVMRHARESTKLAIGGINRVLFPLSALLGIGLGKWLLAGWQHIGLLQISIKLLLALALIRLSVYALRYIFDPSGWLKTFERMITWVIWGVLALHLTGDLPRIINALESVQFTLGKGKANLWMLLQGVFTIVVTLFVTLWLSRLIENKLMRIGQLTPNIRVVLVKLVRIFFIVIGVLFALSAAGLDITLLSVFGGALGVGLGFGLQKIASNYVSGFIILLDKSMQIGDMVSVDRHHGIIHDMRSRYMVLVKQDGTNVIIPNEILITSAVVNYSSEHIDRVQVNVCVSYGSPLELAMQLMQQAAAKQERVLKAPAPEVVIKGLVEQGVELVLNVWVADPEKPIAPLRSALYLEIWKAFRTEEIILVKTESNPSL